MDDPFSTTGNKLNSKIQPPKWDTFRKCLEEPNKHNVFLYPTTIIVIETEEQNLSLKKVGGDDIKPAMLKRHKAIL